MENEFRTSINETVEYYNQNTTAFIDSKAEAMQFLNEFDAVWACASMLHVSRNQQKKVLSLISEALKPNGICYCSWKYGDEKQKG